jgi:alkylation response protein AidB-like acyl-CoA dehydrogenase
MSAVDPSALQTLREEVRAFLATADFEPSCDAWMRCFEPEFSRELGRRGWTGMTIPARWGGHDRTFVERYVVSEELLRAGAPVAAHWITDRQIGPTLLNAGNDRLRAELLPGICRGETYFCVGMSEPNAGSDLSAIATRATADGDDWLLSGQKVWTTGAMTAHFCYVVARTARPPDRPHEGLSEFVVPMEAEGLTVRPILDLSGEAHFAELFFDEVRVPGWRLVGEPGEAFRQVIRQLDYERSGPERFLSTYPLFETLLAERPAEPSDEWLASVGELAARYSALRLMSIAIAAAMDESGPSSTHSALVKDLGATLEQEVVGVVRDLLDAADARPASPALERRLRDALVSSPNYPIRGGTREILREIVARRQLKLERAS